MFAVEEITDPRDLSRYREDWGRLLAQSSRPDFFLTHEWLSTWLEFFWRDRPIAFMFFRQNGSLTGLAPLVRDEAGALWCRDSVALPIHPHARRADLLHTGDAEEVLRALLTRLGSERHRLRLAAHVMRSSSLRAVLPRVVPYYAAAVIEREAPGSLSVRIDGDWDSYLKFRSTHVRSELRRKTKKFDRSRRGRWRVLGAPETCDEAMAAVFRIERRSWKAEHGEALTSSESIMGFYRELARRCAEAGWLRIYLLEFDDHPIAYVYGVVYGKEYLALKTSYDQSYGMWSPGAVLFGYSLRDAFDLGVSAFDFLGEEARWKRELATDRNEHVYVCVVPRGSYRCMCCQLYQCHLKPFLKRRLPGLVASQKRLKHELLRRKRTATSPPGNGDAH